MCLVGWKHSHRCGIVLCMRNGCWLYNPLFLGPCQVNPNGVPGVRVCVWANVRTCVVRVLSLKAGNRDGQIAAEKEFCFWIVQSETSQIGSFPSSSYLTVKPQEIRICFDFFLLKIIAGFCMWCKAIFKFVSMMGTPTVPSYNLLWNVCDIRSVFSAWSTTLW